MTRTFVIGMLTLVAFSSHARADGDQLTLPKGTALLNAQLEIDLSSGAAFKPVSLSPDFWYGLSDKLTLGLVHSTLGGTGFMGGFGDSLCLTGSSNGCEHFYRNVGADARYSLASGTWAWAADGGLYIRDTSPFELAVKLGVDGRWHSGKLAVELDPSFYLGLTNRGTTNTETLGIPVTGIYEVAPKWNVLAQLGLILPFTATGDTFTIPLSLGGQYQVNEHLNLGLAFSLPALLGGSKVDTGADLRTLTIGGGYAF